MKLIIRLKSFEGHAGRPGMVGGSLPRGMYMSPQADEGSGGEMSEDAIIEETRKGLLQLKRNANSWAARDTLMKLGNEFLGTDWVSLGGDEGMLTARKIADQLMHLDDSTMLDIYDRDSEGIGAFGDDITDYARNVLEEGGHVFGEEEDYIEDEEDYIEDEEEELLFTAGPAEGSPVSPDMAVMFFNEWITENAMIDGEIDEEKTVDAVYEFAKNTTLPDGAPLPDIWFDWLDLAISEIRTSS